MSPQPTDPASETPRDKGVFQATQPIEGLPGNGIRGIAQDHRGYIWIVGPSRLYRYDGYEFQCFSNTAADSLLHRWTYSGLEGGRHGTLCIYGSADEVVLYDVDRSSAQVYRLGDDRMGDSKTLHTSTALEDSLGRFVIGTWEGTVVRIDPRTGEVRILSHANAVAGGFPVSTLAEDADGNIWAGGERGIRCVSGSGEEARPGQSSRQLDTLHPPDGVAVLIRGRGASLRVARLSGEIGVFDTRSGRYLPTARVDHAGLDNPVRDMVEDLSGNLWIAPGIFGLDRLRPGESVLERYFWGGRGPYGPAATVHRLFVDRSGLLWIGTWTQGLWTYAPWRKKFHSATPSGVHLDTLSGKYVTSVREDREKTLWIGTMGGGLYCLRRGSSVFRAMRPVRGDPGSLSSYEVTCICERKNGDLWIGTVDGGICILHPNASSFLRVMHRLHESGSLGADTVNAIFEDEDGTVWVGHVRGVDRYQDRTSRFTAFIRWPPESVGRTGTAGYFCRDRKGNLWIATAGRGLLRLGVAPGDSVWYRHARNDEGSLPTNGVSCVLEDDRGTVWFGSPAGLSRYVDSSQTFVTYAIRSYTRYSFRPGKARRYHGPSVGVEGILPDRSGNLWLSTTSGVARFDVATGSAQLFGPSDGVAFGEGMRHAFCRVPGGGIFVGGSGGVCWFHPDSMRINVPPPPVVITDFRLLETDSAVSTLDPAGVTLRHDQRAFSVTFAALDYTDPQRNMFSYMLEGVDRNWIHAGTDRKVAYADVAPGAYVLHVRAARGDGVWSEPALSFPIVIAPPFWQTWWFRALGILALGTILYSAYRYRVSRIVAMERLRLRIANDLHDDIGSDLSGIALESDMLARRLSESDPAYERLRSVGRTIRTAADNLRDVVWIVSPDQDRIQDLVDRMREVTCTMLSGIPFSFQDTKKGATVPLDMEFKRHVLMMYKEMMHNVVSHARATNVLVEFTLANNHLKLCVKDNGIGFDTSKAYGGRGLRSLRSRASAIGGKLTIESAPQSGTVVCLDADITRL